MEKSYNHLGHEKNGLDHAYGEDVHILAEPFTLGMLAELGKPETRQPRFNEILETLYRGLLQRMICLLYTSPSPRDKRQSRMPSSA